jgi:hypothetical protein
MRRLVLAGVLIVGGMFGVGTAEAGCTVNVGTCDGGCTVNLGYCAPAGSCLVNAGACGDGSLITADGPRVTAPLLRSVRLGVAGNA